MMGLAQLYKKYCLHHEAGKESALKISWIKDKLLHIYYQNSIDDKYELQTHTKKLCSVLFLLQLRETGTKPFVLALCVC